MKIIHTGEEPFACDHKDCGKTFNQKPNLIRHKRSVHLKEKRFECEYKVSNKSQRNSNVFGLNVNLRQYERVNSEHIN